MISKTLLDSFWIVLGKEEAKESRFIDKAWLRSILPPYYAGHGFAIRVGKYVLRFGVCTPLYRDVDFSSELDVAAYVTMGSNREDSPHDIGGWGCSDEENQQHETEASAQESVLPESEPQESLMTNS